MNDLMRRVTAIGRPLDPAWATNRAVMALIPVGAALAWLRASLTGDFASPLTVAVLGGATVLGAWALGRELAPDPQGAAFLSLALGFGVYLWDPSTSILLLFTGLVLARIVNRTTGLAPTPADTAGALALVVWAVSEGAGPGPALAALVAYAGDAALPGGLARHWGAAALSGLVAGWALLGPAAVPVPAPDPAIAVPGLAGLVSVVIVAAAFARRIAATRRIASVGDETGVPLDPARVRGGMAAVLVLALGATLQGDAGVRSAALLWAVTAGVALWRRGDRAA